MTATDIASPALWALPLNERLRLLGELREAAPFTRATSPNQLTGVPDEFFAVTRHAEVIEISRRAADFCSGRGATNIPDMPAEALEYFGSFINMDDPRHARQRGIVARSFTPRQLQGVLDSVERICDEVIDGFCEQGEVDLVEAFSQPFPLLIICDMMGIPRSEFTTVLEATNVILGSGDPDSFEGDDIITALFAAGEQLTSLMRELADHRREHPADDLTTKLVFNDVDEDMLDPSELGAFFILLAVAGNDTTRTALSHGTNILSQFPDQREIWKADPDEITPTAVEEIVRYATPVTFMRRTVTRDLELSGREFSEGDRMVLFYGIANRDPRVFTDPEIFDVNREPNNHLGFGGPGPHFCLGAHLARRELSVGFRRMFDRLGDLEVVGDAVPLQAAGVPLVAGLKHLPVRFTPSAPLGG
ncbi:MAG TPA: cytochrome P450 [Acidimicrobiales bacterium]|nr:cytochrome P450 [Acidimicrobiales bacterium]